MELIKKIKSKRVDAVINAYKINELVDGCNYIFSVVKDNKERIEAIERIIADINSK